MLCKTFLLNILTLDVNRAVVVKSLDDVDVIGVIVVVVVVILWPLNILCKLGINGGIVLLLIPTKSEIREVVGGSCEFFPYSTNYENKII